MLSYEEIKKYHSNGLLDSMRLSLGLPWERIINEVLNHESVLAEEVERLEKVIDTLGDKEEQYIKIVDVYKVVEPQS